MSCPAFIAQSLAVRTAAHLLHLSSTSYSQHMALGDFYEELEDLIDRYAEVYMGMEGQVKRWPSVTPPEDTPVTLLEDYLDAIHEEMGAGESEALESILAELEELTSQSLYKVRHLK